MFYSSKGWERKQQEIKNYKKERKSHIICNLTCLKLISTKSRLIPEMIKRWLIFSGQEKGWLIIDDYGLNTCNHSFQKKTYPNMPQGICQSNTSQKLHSNHVIS